MNELPATIAVRLAHPFPDPSTWAPADAAWATDELAFTQSVLKALEDAKREATTPIRIRLEELRAGFDRLIRQVDEAVTRIKAALLQYRQQQKALADTAAREEAVAQGAIAGAEAQADALALGLPAAEAQAIAARVALATEAQARGQVAPAPLPRTTAGEAGLATTVATWTFEIVDPDIVPRAFLSVDAVKLRKAVQFGARAVPGVRIFQRESIAGRRRGPA